MDVDLRSLKAFLSVVEAGGFSAAARAKSVSQIDGFNDNFIFGEFFVNIDELLIDLGSRCSARRLHGSRRIGIRRRRGRPGRRSSARRQARVHY